MARYFFHTRNGHRVDDDTGIELATLDEARARAVRLLCELLPITADFWDRREIKVIVRDDHDLTLFEIEAFATIAPVHSGR